METISNLEERIARMEAVLADAATGKIESIEVTEDDPFSSVEVGLNIVLEDLRDEIAAGVAANRELDKKVAQRTAELEEKLRTISEQSETIRQQRDAILELSTPVLQVWDGILAVPVIGEVDTRRGSQITENLLAAIAERRAEFVIVDITGVEVVDTSTAQHFVRSIKAARLLGVQSVLTGVRPPVAKTLVSLGADLSEVCTRSTMQEGLKLCIQRMAEESAAPGGGASVDQQRTTEQ